MQASFQREKGLSNTCFGLHLISSLVNSHQPDPTDLEKDEKTECQGPQGMKGDGGGPWDGHTTRGHQQLKASLCLLALAPCLKVLVISSCPPTRRTDVERSPVLRVQDTVTRCPCTHRQASHTVTQQMAEPSQVRGSNHPCTFAMKGCVG